MLYIKKRSKLIKNILIVAAPAIIEMTLNTMLMVADTLMVSHMIGKEAISATGIVTSIFFLLVFVFSSFNTGAVAMISRNYGKKDMITASEIANNNLLINLFIGLLITFLALIFKNMLFLPFDVTKNVLSSAQEYYTIIIYGMIFQFGSFAFASISRGVGDTKTPMYITAFANIINIIFNYVLIKGVGFFPEMGITGAAIATTGARVLAFIIYIKLFASGKHKIKLTLPTLKLNPLIAKQLWKISYPGAVEQLLMQGSFFLIGIIVTFLDTSSEALFRILITIESISFMPAVGISIATATLVGKALGEKDIDKAADTGYLATGMSALWGVFIGSIFFLFPEQLLSIFTSEAHIIHLGKTVFILMAINQIFLNSYIVMSGALRGAGDTNAVMKITSLRLWLIHIPMSYILIHSFNIGVSSVWYAEIASFIIFSMILIMRFHKRKWAELEL